MSTADKGKKAPLIDRKIALFLLSQNVSLFGSSVVGFAIIWYITLETSSGMWLMLSTICSMLPQVIISLWGGVWADRRYACYISNHSYSWQVYGYRIYLTKEELNNAYQKLYQDEIGKLIKEGLSACVYTQLSDIEDEVNGLLTYDRKVCKVEPLSKDIFRFNI